MQTLLLDKFEADRTKLNRITHIGEGGILGRLRVHIRTIRAASILYIPFAVAIP